jgi:hypothetical protein
MGGSYVTGFGTGISGLRKRDDSGGKQCAEDEATRFHGCTPQVLAICFFFRRKASGRAASA